MRLVSSRWSAALVGIPLVSGCVAESKATTETHDLSATADAGMTPRKGDGPDMDAGSLSMMDAAMAVLDASAPSDAGVVSAPTELNCESYCTLVTQVCTGYNSQYASREQCLHMCADTPLGTLLDTSGDTVGCRMYHASAAVRLQDPVNHCKHAGPTGGEVCGSRCEVLCDRASKLCTSDRGFPEAYPSKSACLDRCDPEGGTGYAVDEENELPATGDTVNCRIYHLRSAYSNVDPDGGTAIDHCPHVGAVSETCN